MALARHIRKTLPKAPDLFIYFLSAERRDYPVKIGITSQKGLRLAALQTANPYQVKLLALLPVADRTLEGQLHTRFKASRLAGEWFLRTQLMTLIKTIGQAADRVADKV